VLPEFRYGINFASVRTTGKSICHSLSSR